MAFSKIGAVFPITQAKVSTLNEWSSFKKTASLTAVIEEPIKIAEEKRATEEKTADFQVVADIDPEKFIYIHTTIMAGVKTGSVDYWVTPETEKYINDNHDAWKCDDLLKDYSSFRKATTFVEHDQNIERARGKCIDAIARKLPDTILIDVLFSVDKRHSDLCNNITAGIINAVSMGCTTEKTVCSICGHEAADSDKYCSHIRNGKGQQFICKDGTRRRAAELCKNNSFFDVSLVANPAFAGAVFRKILSSSQASNHLLANILTSKIENINNSEIFLKAASKDAEMTVKNDGSVNVKEADKEIKGSLTKEDLDSIKNIFTAAIKEEKSATTFLSKIVNKFFGKNSNHPIQNDSSKADFAISDEDYSSIERDYVPPYNIRDEFLKQDKEHGFELNKVKEVKEEEKKKKASRFNDFICFKCGHEADLWRVKAASIDLGHSEVIECPKCAFLMESAIYSQIKKAIITAADKLQLNDLGFNDGDISKMSKEQADVVIMNSVPKEDFARDQNAFMRSSSMFIVNEEIPTRKESNKLIFDLDGDHIVGKGEKLHLVAAKKNVGMFKTEQNEFVYLPVAAVPVPSRSEQDWFKMQELKRKKLLETINDVKEILGQEQTKPTATASKKQAWTPSQQEKDWFAKREIERKQKLEKVLGELQSIYKEMSDDEKKLEQQQSKPAVA